MVVASLESWLPPPWLETGGLDIAPFARRCCVQDQHTSQVAFDYEEARTAGQNAERAADGHYIYGLQWAEERDVKEIRVRVRAGNVAPRAERGILVSKLALSTPSDAHH